MLSVWAYVVIREIFEYNNNNLEYVEYYSVCRDEHEYTRRYLSNRSNNKLNDTYNYI